MKNKCISTSINIKSPKYHGIATKTARKVRKNENDEDHHQSPKRINASRNQQKWMNSSSEASSNYKSSQSPKSPIKKRSRNRKKWSNFSLESANSEASLSSNSPKKKYKEVEFSKKRQIQPQNQSALISVNLQNHQKKELYLQIIRNHQIPQFLNHHQKNKETQKKRGRKTKQF